MSEVYQHQPVMVREVVEAFQPMTSGVLVDATVGGGGHARALLEALPGIQLVGLDRDPEAVRAATRALSHFRPRVTIHQARFDQIQTTLGALGHAAVAGVLFDLGVSSPQLDRPQRGFSYRSEGPLDMRMDRTQERTAADVVNGYSEDDLARVIARHSDERFARRIAAAIVAARPITTTLGLADVVRAAIPAPARRRGGHPARRTFQALRMEVNQELEVLPAALDQALHVLEPGGRCVVLSYHSGEDRIVKAAFVDAATGGCTCPPGLPCACGATPLVRPVGRRARRPSADEVARNHRAESARLRVVEKL